MKKKGAASVMALLLALLLLLFGGFVIYAGYSILIEQLEFYAVRNYEYYLSSESSLLAFLFLTFEMGAYIGLRELPLKTITITVISLVLSAFGSAELLPKSVVGKYGILALYGGSIIHRVGITIGPAQAGVLGMIFSTEIGPIMIGVLLGRTSIQMIKPRKSKA